MGEMRDSDWSRPKILRSDWLPIIGAIMTTALYHYDMKLNFTSPLFGVGVNTTQKSFLSLSKLR